MKTSLGSQDINALVAPLADAEQRFARHFPGESGARQPVHTVYGGAHLFKAGTAKKLGDLALRALATYAPDPFALARAIDLPGASTLPSALGEADAVAKAVRENPELARRTDRHAALAVVIYDRIKDKLAREPVEDYRIDFEDGYGNRPDAEEDAHAVAAADETAKGMTEKVLSPFLGIRIKPLSAELRARSIRTLDLYVTALAEKTAGKLPDNFVVTLPKVIMPEQVVALRGLFEALEKKTGLLPGALKMELMIETTQAILAADGRASLPSLIDAGEGRVVSAHFGTYDYTASCNVTAAHQSIKHLSCDFAKHVMQVSLASTGIWMSDGATTVMPIAPHAQPKDGPALGPKQMAENLESVQRAWKLHYDNALHGLVGGFYQGWDLHPAQLITRYAAVYSFFLGGLDAASDRLRNFVDRAAQATLVGDLFDDAATGQGLLNFFLRAKNCGALTVDEAARLSGLSAEELASRSFVKILAGRRKH
ncbi:MAG: aldolase/citrate lyase family protein [Polyangiaceae bacterium]|nr:aldolase/citrate lyase family protein [Polyangiaceae bacterium]